jgi:aldose 1-epimerase
VIGSTQAASAPSATHDTFEDCEAVTLAAGELRATFVPARGMVGVSLRHRGEELLDRQGGLGAYTQRGAVMGIPLLHPWANRLAGHGYSLHGRDVRLPDGPPLIHCDEHGLPIHGLLSASRYWQVDALDPTAARLRATLDFGVHPELLAAFPFRHALAIEAKLRPGGLTIVTTVEATGGAPVPVAFGFHPYLRLPGVQRAVWRLSLPARRHLVLDERGIPIGNGTSAPAETFALGDRVFDDGYDRLADGAAFSVAGGGRALTVTFDRGFPDGQVFAPAGSAFICFEPMTAPTNALRSGVGLRRVAPGDSFSAAFTIGVDG